MKEAFDDKTKLVNMRPASDFDNLINIKKEKIVILKDIVSKKEISKETFNETKHINSIR